VKLPRAAALALATAVTLSASGPRAATPAADPDAGDGDKARRAQIVARVGDRTIALGELENRIAEVPRFQLTTFGATPDAIRRKFLDEVLVPDLLLARGAQDNHLDTELPTSARIERALANATRRALRAQVGTAAAIPDADVKRYYEENRARFDAPVRVNLWRILCATREEAAMVLSGARKDATVATFTALARDHSIDKATALRGGNLGFVAPDGTSNEAGVKVDPALVRAVDNVKDGELAPAPVQEGSYFAVVWRRGTVAATRRGVDEVAGQIRDTLWKQRTEDAEKKLIDDLRAAHVSEVNEALLNTIELGASDGTVSPHRRPGQVPPLGAVPKPSAK
jgi:peptidyl-prolyl cis-trans isomerase C